MSPVLLFWIVLAVVLVAVELHSVAFFALFGAAGAVAAALVAYISPDAIALQIVVAIAVGIAGILMVRPYVSKAFAQGGSEQRIAGVHGGLISARGITLDVVGSDLAAGHVRILGENWLAVADGDEPIPPDTAVIVTAVAGTTLTVRPAMKLES